MRGSDKNEAKLRDVKELLDFGPSHLVIKKQNAPRHVCGSTLCHMSFYKYDLRKSACFELCDMRVNSKNHIEVIGYARNRAIFFISRQPHIMAIIS